MIEGLTEQIVAVAEAAWLKTSLAADNPDNFLDHSDAEDQSGIYYCPIRWQSKDGKTIWNLKEVTIKRSRCSFSIPVSHLTGIFIDIKRSNLTVAIKDTCFFGDDNPNIPNNLPYDRYMFNDGETYFRISYINDEGLPFAIDPKVIKSITSNR